MTACVTSYQIADVRMCMLSLLHCTAVVLQSEAQARARTLEAEARELRGRLAAAEGRDESGKLSQVCCGRGAAIQETAGLCLFTSTGQGGWMPAAPTSRSPSSAQCFPLQAVLVQRVQELEAALSDSKAAEQGLAAQLARAEGRAAVAEGSRAAQEQQLGQGLAELQAAHAEALAAEQAKHERELAELRREAEQAAAAAKAAADAREARLTAANAALEASVRREQARARELQAQLDKAGAKQEAVRELMRHSEALQAQVDRLQAAAAEDKRRGVRAAAAAEAALQQERQLAEAAAQEAQHKAQASGVVTWQGLVVCNHAKQWRVCACSWPAGRPEALPAVSH